MYTYKNYNIKNPICIHFLCGCEYERDNLDDKRNVLLNYINSIDYNYGLILEKQFKPSHYEEMNFKDLEDVELMTAYYAKSIIIVHETISTGAEIALFGSKKNLSKKVLVLHAPKSKTKINYITNFLRLAYFKNNKVIKKNYNFDTELFYPFENENICYYKTSFANRELSSYLKNEIINFWDNSNNDTNIFFGKKGPKSYNNYYQINKNTKEIRIILDYYFILTFIIGILSNDNLYKTIRKISTSVKNICYLLKKILLNTIEYKEKINYSDFKCIIKMKDSKETFLPVKYCLNILKAVGLINIRNNNIIITNEFKHKFSEYNNLLMQYNPPNFFGDVLNEK